jgi:hypothetical protein
MTVLRQMGPLNMSLKFMGTKNMEMDSGFEAPVDLWEKCTGKKPGNAEILKQLNSPLDIANPKAAIDRAQRRNRRGQKVQ